MRLQWMNLSPVSEGLSLSCASHRTGESRRPSAGWNKCCDPHCRSLSFKWTHSTNKRRFIDLFTLSEVGKMPKSIGTNRSPAASYCKEVKRNLTSLIYSFWYTAHQTNLLWWLSEKDTFKQGWHSSALSTKQLGNSYPHSSQSPFMPVDDKK